MKTKAVIYARVSSVNDRQEHARQIEDLKKVCPFAGYRDSTDISRTHKRSKED